MQGKNSDGTTYPLDEFTADAGQLELINHAKTAGESGSFELTFTSPDGKKATVEVVLKTYMRSQLMRRPESRSKDWISLERPGEKPLQKNS